MSQIQQNGDASTGNYYQGTSTKNNGGSIIAGGSNPVRNLVKQNPKGSDVGVFASVVVKSDLVGNTKSVTGGTFAHNHVKPISAKITTELAGVGNTAILKGADKVTRSIHKIESFITNRTATAFRAGFNMYTGAFSGAITTATDSLGNDVAANPTSAVPGKLTYQTGSNVATVDSYHAKTSA